MPNTEILKQGVRRRIELLRKERAPTPRPVITLTPVRVDPAALAARIRALMVQNDPDAVRAELEAIADALTERSDFAELLPAAAA